MVHIVVEVFITSIFIARLIYLFSCVILCNRYFNCVAFQFMSSLDLIRKLKQSEAVVLFDVNKTCDWKEVSEVGMGRMDGFVNISTFGR